uniref:hypothetical protein n=1 Tax=Streptomyces chartreusis TaxID=1969 RepID=UPI003F494821
MSDSEVSAHAQRLQEEVRRLLRELQHLSDEPDTLAAATSALAEPLRQSFADLAVVCDLLAQAAPHSIHQGPLRESVSALHVLDRQWYAVKLNGGCFGVA